MYTSQKSLLALTIMMAVANDEASTGGGYSGDDATKRVADEEVQAIRDNSPEEAINVIVDGITSGVSRFEVASEAGRVLGESATQVGEQMDNLVDRAINGDTPSFEDDEEDKA